MTRPAALLPPAAAVSAGPRAASAATVWTVAGSGRCPDRTADGTANGTVGEIRDCNHGGSQVWSAR